MKVLIEIECVSTEEKAMVQVLAQKGMLPKGLPVRVLELVDD